MPREPVAIIVLGCPPVVRGDRPNPYFLGRVEAAIALHRAHPEAPILCTGTRDRHGRDEAAWLAAALTRRDVAPERIATDAGSARTRDSLDEAARRYPEHTLVFVTQSFHLPRVLDLARWRSLDARGATAPGPRPSTRLRLREALARARAWIER